MSQEPHLYPCQHFEQCGGCTQQHLDESSYHHFKYEIVRHLVGRLGLQENVIADMIHVGPKSRRRAEFKIAVNKGLVSVGFFAAKSHDVVDISMCPVTEPELFALISPLRDTISKLKKPGNIKSLSVTLLDDGIDSIISVKSPLMPTDKESLAAFASATPIVRLMEKVEDQETYHRIYEEAPATIAFSGVDVKLPVASFLQPTKAGQLAITKLVLEYLKSAKRVVDLYSGCGTYSFPLAKQGSRISAYEGAEEMIMAMQNAIRQHDLEQQMHAMTRDLYRKPLTAKELETFDGAVINPPRNGALPQAKQLAASKIPNIVMASCNPNTFERDAKALLEAGYKLESLTPVDQFYWTEHLEVVGKFSG